MPTIIEQTSQIVAAHATGTNLSSDDLIKNIHAVFNALKALETGESVPTAESVPEGAPTTPTMTIKQAFKNKDSILCMICGKGFKTLKRHLTMAHDLKPGAYRKQFNIPSAQSLVAKNYSEQRKKDALDRGQGEILAKARAARAAKNAIVPAVKIKASVPVVKAKVPVPVPAVKKKPAVPAKAEASTVPLKAAKSSKVKPASKAKK